MSNILISPPPTTLLTGLLQLSGGVAMSSTPVYVTDQNNTASPLALATANVKIGTTTASSYLLDVNGNARVRTNFEITSGTTADMYLNYQNSGNIYYQYSGVTYWQQSVDNNDNFRIYSGTKGIHMQRANGYITLNNGSTTLSSILGVKGSGSTSATTTFLAQNSSSTQLMKLTDDGRLVVGSGTVSGNAFVDIAIGSGSTNGLRVKAYSDAGTGYIFSGGTESFADNFKIKMVNGNVTMGTQLNGYTFGLETFNGTALQIFNSGNISIGNTTESAKLFVKGSGTTSATSSLLVQNNSGTQLLKTLDDGSVEAGGNTANQFKVMNTEGLAISRDGSLDANIRIREFSGSGPVIKMNGNSTPTFKFIDSSNFQCILSHSTWTGIGKGVVENTSAALQVESTTKGFLPPKMTTVQKLAITTPAAGLQVYDTTLNQMSYYNGGAWVNF